MCRRGFIPSSPARFWEEGGRRPPETRGEILVVVIALVLRVLVYSFLLYILTGLSVYGREK